jgi:hypothetical protein
MDGTRLVFTVPGAHDLLGMNAGLIKYYNFGVVNTWVAGLPAVILGSSTISPSALKYGRFGLAVVNQTTNALLVSQRRRTKNAARFNDKCEKNG